MRDKKLSDYDTGVEQKTEDKFDPLMATFQESKGEPYHGWYSYLEGYSTSFVRTVIKEYMNDADRIFDPFGGTVTTGFKAGSMGRKGIYCEVNPAMQFIAETKSQVRTLEEEDRQDLVENLENIKDNLESLVSKNDRHRPLEYAYNHVFEDSEFFFEDNYENILKLKSAIIEIEGENKLASDVLTVATLSALLPCSKLKRAGDVRFMSEDKLEEGLPDILETVDDNLENMIQDIKRKKYKIDEKPTLIAENAKNLHKIPNMDIDGLITSPPYVNGTNYFRNTKLELWFLECIKTSKDLKKYRDKALTAGINSVSGEYDVPNIPIIEEVVEDLEEHGYDRRLPLMVAGYFGELKEIFSKIKPHLNENATVAIDIGDSKYAGIHVPAGEMLIEVMEKIGYTHEETVKLRDRYSNNGEELRQVLIIFSN